MSGQGRSGQRAYQAGRSDLLDPARTRRIILSHPRNLSPRQDPAGARPGGQGHSKAESKAGTPPEQGRGGKATAKPGARPEQVIDRSYGIPGAQPAEVFLGALRRAYAGQD